MNLRERALRDAIHSQSCVSPVDVYNFEEGWKAAVQYQQSTNQQLLEALKDLLEFAEEVRRTGDTRLASMAIALINKATGCA